MLVRTLPHAVVPILLPRAAVSRATGVCVGVAWYGGVVVVWLRLWWCQTRASPAWLWFGCGGETCHAGCSPSLSCHACFGVAALRV